jgi:type IV pilus assembly protein PilM
MLNLAGKGVKAQLDQWVAYFKKFADMFSTAKDVYTDLLGIDLDDSSITLTQFRNPLGVMRVARAEVIDLPAGVMLDDTIIDNAALAGAIKKVIQDRGIRAANAVIAIPGSKVVIKQVKLEAQLNDFDAEARAWQEARKTFPEIAKSLYLDFIQVEEPGLGKNKKYNLVIIAVRKEDILPRVECLQQSGLVTKIVDVDYYALERAYQLFASQLPPEHVIKYVAAIDFNPHSILFLVLHKKKVVYYNRQAYTGDVLVPLVQRAMGLESVSVKNKPAIKTPLRITPMQVPFQETADASPVSQPTGLNDEQKSHVVMSIRRLFQAFYGENPGRIIEHIALSGRCALLSDVTQYVEKTLDIPVTVVNPLLSVRFGEKVYAEQVKKLGPAFTISCGLAMRGVPVWT